MAVAFDAFTRQAATTASMSFTHTPVGTPRGVIVFVVDNGATANNISAVSYGGVAMSAVALSPLIRDAAEDCVLHGYFLGSSIPTGAQTVSVTVTAATTKVGYCITLTGAADTSVQDTSTIDTTAIGDITGTLSLGGNSCFAAEVLWSGLGNPFNLSPLTGWSDRDANTLTDLGAQVCDCYTYDTVGTSDVTFGANQANSDGFSALAVAIKEVAGGTTFFQTVDAIGKGAVTLQRQTAKIIAATGIGVPATAEAFTVAQAVNAVGIGTATTTQQSVFTSVVNAIGKGVAAVSRQTNKLVSAVGIGTPTLQKQTNKTISAFGVGIATETDGALYTIARTAVGAGVATTTQNPIYSAIVSAVGVGVGTVSTIYTEGSGIVAQAWRKLALKIGL